MTIKDEQIKILDDRGQSRTKLPVFYGSKDNFMHGFREVIANSNDEIRNNFKEGYISVWLSEDNQTISVLDTGRGIPFWGETDGVPNYELLFRTLFAGTNYENIEKGKVSTGTNGLGVTVLNYTSEYYKVEAWRDGYRYEVEFNNGGYLIDEENPVKKYKDSSVPHGTKLTFKLDKDVYTNTIYDPTEIAGILNRLAGVSNNITVKYTYADNILNYHYDSVEEYFNENVTNRLSNTFSFPMKEYHTKVEIEGIEKEEINRIGLSFCLATDIFQETYLNYTFLGENGSIYDGVVEGIRRFFNKNSSSKSKYTAQDIEMSFSFVSYLESTNPEFANQTKFSTKKDLYKKIAIDYIQEYMEIFKLENEQVFNAMVKHLETVNKFNDSNEKKRKELSKKLTEKADGLTSRPEKFIPCDSDNPNETELILTEGDSAKAVIIQSRCPNTQALFPLKGKPQNVSKKSIDKILSNEEILNIFQILGCGVTIKGKNCKNLPPFDINKINYKKILMATDADQDGSHIVTLLINIFYNLAPAIIENGMLYVLKTPLYIAKDKKTKENIYLHNDDEKDKFLTNHNENDYTIKRYKGLGSHSAESMAYSLDKDTRLAIQVTIDDVKEAEKTLDTLLGVDVEPRKEFILKHSKEYFDYSLLED